MTMSLSSPDFGLCFSPQNAQFERLLVELVVPVVFGWLFWGLLPTFSTTKSAIVMLGRGGALLQTPHVAGFFPFLWPCSTFRGLLCCT